VTQWSVRFVSHRSTPRQSLVLEHVMKILALSSVLFVFFFPLLVMSEYSLQESIRDTFFLFSDLKTFFSRFNALFFASQ
jgi:hypothetical protein